jgi:VWFA-related protein
LFDFAFNNARGVTKAKKAAQHFLETQVRPDDEVGVLTYSMLKGVTVHEYLTRDHAKVREVVDSIGSKDIAGRAHEIEQDYWLMAQEPVSPDPQKAAADERNRESEREEAKRIAETFILKLTSLAKALRYLPGQKHFILFSTGIPSSLIFGSQAGNPADLGGRARFDPSDRVLRTRNEEMYKEFAAANCVVYAFDTRESAMVTDLFAYDRMTMEAGGRGAGRGTFTTQGIFQDATSVFQDDKTTGGNSLRRLTDLTGGKYFSNINMYEKNLDEVQSLTGTYYVLGYSVGESEDGRFHKVKVEVKRQGCQVRAQSGYFDPKPFRDYTDLEKRLHLFDLALNGRSPFGVPVAMAATVISFPTPGGTYVQILSKIPSEAMAKFAEKNLEYVAVILDSKDDITSFQRSQASPQARGDTDAVITSGVDLKPGRYRCRVIVRDLETGMTCFASVAVEVPEGLPAGLSLRPPLLLVQDVPPVYITTNPTAEREVAAWKEFYPFDVARFSPVVGGVRAGASKIYAVIPYAPPGPSGVEIGWTAYLVRHESRERVPLTALPLASLKSGGLQVQFLELSISGLPPGEYDVRFRAEAAGGASAEVSIPLKIVN